LSMGGDGANGKEGGEKFFHSGLSGGCLNVEVSWLDKQLCRVSHNTLFLAPVCISGFRPLTYLDSRVTEHESNVEGRVLFLN
jgi:hypothetical protein